MFKGLGCILILISSSLLGYAKGQEVCQRLKELEELKRIFVLLKKELEYTRAPIAELLSKLAQKAEGTYKPWLEELSRELEEKRDRTFLEIWKSSIEENLSEIRMNSEVLEELISVGNNLGYSENIELYLEKLEFVIRDTREETKIKKKLYQSVGVMGGTFLIILLL